MPDLKGFGENQGMDHPYSLDDYLSEVVSFLDENGIVKPHVIAHSFGGRIALKLAYKRPNLFDKLVLTGCAGLKPKRSLKYHLKRACFRISKPFLKDKKPKAFYSSDYLSQSGVMRESFVKIINEHLDYTLPYIKNKTLLVFGDMDKETPLYVAKKLKNGIKDSRLITVKGAGHFCFVDEPEKFNWEVREFLLSK